MNKRRWFLSTTLLLLFSLMLPVFAAKVKSQVGKDANFAAYKTYQWLPPKVLTKTGVIEDHPLNPLVKEIVGQQLASKGLTEVADGGDLLVQVFVFTEPSPQLEAVFMAGMDPYMMYGTPVATMGRYNHEGSLLLNLIERQSNKSAWSAMATKTLPKPPLKPDEVRKKLGQAAADIFEKYPKK